MRKADAIAAASKPSTVCSISGARMPASIAGCAQANISASRSSGIASCGSAQVIAISDEKPQMIGGTFRRPPLPDGVDLPAARDGQQPAFRIPRDTVLRPVDERGGEGGGERILRPRHVARPGREERYELAVALASHPFERYIGQIGRTSTVPWLAPGQREAHEIAESRSGTSMRK